MKKPVLLCIFSFLLFSGQSPAAESPAARDYQAANKLSAAGRYQDALVLYGQVLSAGPSDIAAGEVYDRMGDVYFRSGDYPHALASYRKALADPRLADRPQTQYWVGFCCFLVGRDAEAVTELLKVPALYPDAKAWGSTAYYWAGRASERMGKKEDAALYYRKAGGSGRTTQSAFAQKKAEAVKGK